MNPVKLLSAIFLVYVFYAAFLFFAQRQMMYPGKTIQAPDMPSPMVGRTTLWLKTRFGKVETWFFPGQGKGKKPLLIFFHGNGEIIDFLPWQIEGFNAMGVGVLAVEYPGYGRSQGSTSEESITETALAAYDMVTKREDVDPSRVIAFGRSLGGGAACALSRQRPLAALILQSPFTSTRPFARRYLLPSFLVRDVFDNAVALAHFPGPVLIFHGRHDDIIPFGHGKELARIARRARFVELPCAHNDCPPDWGEFLKTVEKFLREEKIL